MLDYHHHHHHQKHLLRYIYIDTHIYILIPHVTLYIRHRNFNLYYYIFL